MSSLKRHIIAQLFRTPVVISSCVLPEESYQCSYLIYLVIFNAHSTMSLTVHVRLFFFVKAGSGAPAHSFLSPSFTWLIDCPTSELKRHRCAQYSRLSPTGRYCNRCQRGNPLLCLWLTIVFNCYSLLSAILPTLSIVRNAYSHLFMCPPGRGIS